MSACIFQDPMILLTICGYVSRSVNTIGIANKDICGLLRKYGKFGVRVLFRFHGDRILKKCEKAGLVASRQVRLLSFSMFYFSDKAVAFMAKFYRVHLSVENPKQVEFLRSCPPNVDQIDMKVSNLSELRYISHFQLLERLDVKSIYAHGAYSLENIIECSKLRHLSISVEKVEYISKCLLDICCIGNFQELETLHISDTQVFKSGDTSSLGLKNLWFLRLLNCNINEVSYFTDCVKLKCLDISGSRVKTLEFVRHFAELAWLICDDCPVAELEPVVQLRNLRKLHVRNTNIRDLTALAGIVTLVDLSIQDTRVSDLTPLSRLYKLQRLNIGGTDVATVADIAGFKMLTVLVLNGLHVRDITAISRLPKLSSLYLRQTDVTSVACLLKTRSLRYVFICNCTAVDREILYTKKILTVYI
jgi:Leucine-rich repeat (LRR) protein